MSLSRAVEFLRAESNAIVIETVLGTLSHHSLPCVADLQYRYRSKHCLFGEIHCIKHCRGHGSLTIYVFSAFPPYFWCPNRCVFDVVMHSNKQTDP